MDRTVRIRITLIGEDAVSIDRDVSPEVRQELRTIAVELRKQCVPYAPMMEIEDIL